MPIDHHRYKASLGQLQPSMRLKVERWLNDAQAENLLLFVDFTWRSRAEQRGLYAKGRKKVGPLWIITNRRLVVTNAPPGSSYHEYGLAVDVYPLVDGLPRFTSTVPIRVVDLAKRNGLAWGGNWRTIKDAPHFQDAHAPSIRECKKLWPNGWTAS